MASSLGEVIVKSPSTPDIMGYCNNPWISDYMYGRILTFRGPAVAAVAARSREVAGAATLVVSGMISGDSIRLDPAFEVDTRPVLPAVNGSQAIEGRAADGSVVFRTTFTALPTDHGDPAIRYFTFAIPLTDADMDRLTSLELSGEGRRARQDARGSARRLRLLAPGAAADAAGVSVTARSATLVDLAWDAADWPSVLIRDPATRGVLAIGRDGRARVVTRGRILELVMSDGVRSVVVQRAVAGR
jgi:hypothetical protein